jgi:hypothetical protein
MTIGSKSDSVDSIPDSILTEEELPLSSEICLERGEFVPSAGFDF